MSINIKAVIIFGLIGLYSILAGAMNWEFFFNNKRAQVFVRMFGRNGARVFYVILGIAIAVLSFFVKF